MQEVDEDYIRGGKGGKMMARIKDLTGLKFGRLTVLCDSGMRNKNRNIIWRCRCDCGNISNVCGSNLLTGHSVSCDCFKREGASVRGKEMFDRLWALREPLK